MRFLVGLLLTLVLCDAAAADPKLLFEMKGLEQPEVGRAGSGHRGDLCQQYRRRHHAEGRQRLHRQAQADGTIATKSWVKGLNAPTGMALHDRTLYVADVDELVEINVASGEIVKRYPAKGAIFLNDVAVGEDGTVYASDTPMNTIWRLTDGSFEPWFANDVVERT